MFTVNFFRDVTKMAIYDSRIQCHKLVMKRLVCRSLSDNSIHRLVLQSEKERNRIYKLVCRSY